MVYYYGGHHGPITKLDVSIFIAMNIFWIAGWIITVFKWLWKLRKYKVPFGRITLLDYRTDSLLFNLIDGVMCIFWVFVIIGVCGKIISMFI